MRVTVTGASGLIGSALVAELREHGAEVTVLSRDPSPRTGRAGCRGGALGPAQRARPGRRRSAGADAVVHLAGENVAQRWTERAKRAILESRVTGTRNLLAGLRGGRPGESSANARGR